MKARLGLVTVLAIAMASLTAPAVATDGAVTFRAFNYTPSTSRITPGGTVTFSADAGNDFDGTTAGPAHHPLYFDNTAVGNITSGTTASKTFAAAGVYTYYCAFHAALGMKGKIVVTTNQLPTASFTVSVPTGTTLSRAPVPIVVSFDASASRDPDGTITKYEWDWDNNGTIDETDPTPTATHGFTAPATVALTVVDSNGDAVGPEPSTAATQPVNVMSALDVPSTTTVTKPPPPTVDRTPPKVSLTTTSLHLSTLRGGHAKVAFTTSEAGSAAATLKLGSATVGSGKASFAKAGKISLALKLTASGKTKLHHVKHVALKLSLVVADVSGNRATKTLSLRRVS